MYLKKIILGTLILSLFNTNLTLLSQASTDIPNRYETLEGEVVTINNSQEGFLKNIEIFGNTIQNENDLQDIQSVGDLYVDKNGIPILDEQGREQYKIEIISDFGFNLANKVNPQYQSHLDGHRVETYRGYKFINNRNHLGTNLRFNMDCDIKKTYTVQMDIVKNTMNTSTLKVLKHTAYNPIITVNSGNTRRIKFKLEPYSNDILFYLNIAPIIEDEYIEIENLIVFEGDYTNIDYSIDDLGKQKQTILLPTQLMKVGNTSDKLYWDSDKSKYIIEKNTLKFVPTNITRGITEITSSGYISLNRVNDIQAKDTKLIIDSNIYVGNRGSDWVTLRVKSDFFYGAGYLLTESDANRFLNDYPTSVICATLKSKIIETNITKQLKIPTYTYKTCIYTETENGIKPTLKVTIDRLTQVSQNLVTEAISNSTLENIALARACVNLLPESLYKDSLQEQLNQLFSSGMELERQNLSSNVDIYIKCENILLMSLDTNSITFEDFSGADDIEKLNAINITVNSSLPYQINAYLPTEIQNSDGSNIIDKQILNIKENRETEYKTFTNVNEKVILKDNCIAGNSINHSIDLMLKGGIAHEKDVYKSTIKLEIEQK